MNFGVALALLGWAAGPPATADDGGVIVVAPSPNGTKVPVAPDEKVDVTVVKLPGGARVAVVRKEKLPPKPKFNIITPEGVSHPFVDGDTGVDGITVTHEPIVVHDRDGKTWYRVRKCFKQGAKEVGCMSFDFPCGSQLVPDPPQPPGTGFLCPDAVPAPPEEEAAVLAALGAPDGDGPGVWRVPSGELYYAHEHTAIPEVVRITGALADEPPAPSDEPDAAEPRSDEPAETPTAPQANQPSDGETADSSSAEESSEQEPADDTVADGSADDGTEADDLPQAEGEAPENAEPAGEAAPPADESASADDWDRTIPALAPPTCGFGLPALLPLLAAGLVTMKAGRMQRRRRTHG